MKSVPNLFPTIIPADGITKVAMIGEAPGREEEIAGQPFVGAAGRELERWIKPYFIRSQCFVGNVCQDRPPDNKLSNFFTDTACRQPNERLQGWVNILAEQLEKVRPNIIIALGRHPTFLLTGREANWKREGEFTWGSILPCTLVPGLKVIPLPHPSYIMRGLFDLRPVVKVWLKRAKANSMYPEIRRPYRELVVNPSLEQVMFELDRLMYAKELAFDIETVPGKKVSYRNDAKGLIFTADIITCISFSDRPEWSISIPFSTAPGQHRWALDIEKEIWRAISRLLGQHGPLKIAHNLMFDFLELAARKVFVAPPRWDTMTGHNRAYLDLTKKKLKKQALNRLAVCTSLYTEEPFYKNDWKDQNKADKWNQVSHAFWKYNAMDSAVLHEIKAAEERDLEQMGMLDMFHREMRAFDPLAAAALQGTKRDLEIINNLSHFLNDPKEGKIQQLQDELNSVVGYELNTKSSQQMQKFLYSVMGFPIQFNKHTKRPTADEGALAKLYQKTKHPILLRIKELTRLRGFNSNYIEAAISVDGRSRTTYNQARTSTARISSSDALIGEGKNLQTVPSRPRPGEDDYNRLIKDYKKSFIADEGKLLAKRDYVQAEAMVVAWLAEDLQQMDDFQNGIDIHCRTVQILYDIPYETVMNGVLNGDPEWKYKRNIIGKPVRHGCLTPETEILTPAGWVSFSAIQDSTCKAAVWDAVTKQIHFETTDVLEYPYEGEMIRASGPYHKMEYTPEHRVPYFTNSGRKVLSVKMAKDITALRTTYTPIAGNYVGGLLGDIDEPTMRLLAATFADGHLMRAGQGIEFHLSKDRKIARLLHLAESCGAEVREYKSSDNARKLAIFGKAADTVRQLGFQFDKNYGSWMMLLGRKSIEAVVDEAAYWDAVRVTDNTYIFFSSSAKSAEWLATLAHLCGRSASARVIKEKISGYGSDKPRYKVTIKNRPYTTVERKSWSTFSYSGKVYCLSTSTGFFLARKNGTIVVTGNSNYRLGPRQLSQMFALSGSDVSETEARRMLQAMASGVPSVVRWQAEVEDQLKSTRTITNAFGLRRTFFGMIDDDAIREAIAFNPQSTVGQLMNFALARVYHESGMMTDLDILLQIHDAVIFQSPVDKIQQHSAIVGELMDIPLEIKGRRLVVPSDIEIGPSWGQLSKPKWEV